MKDSLVKNVVIAAALLATGFFGAYLRFRPHLGNESTWTDGEQRYESTVAEEIRYAVWDDPLPLPPGINSEDSESRPALSPDGLYLVFVAGRPGLNQDLYLSELVDGEPEPARPLSLLNSPADDIAPAFAGDRLYFASDRTGGKGGFDLYVSRYRNGAFERPEPLDGGLNGAADECDPAPITGSRALAFASNRERGRRSDYDLYLARPWSGSGSDGRGPDTFQVTPLTSLNSPFDEREPAFAADGVTLLFASDREDTLGGFDLFRSVRSLDDRGVFLPPMPLVGVNSSASERGPVPSRDGFSLMFAQEQTGDNFDLYRARSQELFRVPGKPVGWLDLLILLSLLLVALLAWLAKRWETLDILYKCFLVALLLHLLMLWYFQRVLVEGDEVDLPGRDALFQVSIAHARSSNSARQERRGRLESQRAAARIGTPDRLAVQAPASRPSSAPAQTLNRARRPAETGPGRALDRSAPKQARTRSEVAFMDRAAPTPLRTEAASELSLSTPGSSPAPPREVGRAPDRSASDALTALLMQGADFDQPGPSRATLRRSERTDLGDEAPPARIEGVAKPGGRADSTHPAEDLRDGETFEALTDNRSPGSAGDLPTPSVVSAAPAESRAAGQSPGRFESVSRALLDSELEAKLEALKLPAFSELDLPDDNRAGIGAAAPERQGFGGAPTASDSDLPAIALNDSVAIEKVPGRDREQAGSAARTGDSELLLTPTRGALLSRSPGSISAPSRLRFESARKPQVPTLMPLAELARVRPPEPAFEAPKKLEHTPYKNRFGTEKQKAIELHGGSEETEQAVAQGLKYLAGRQNRSGFWGNEEDYEEKYGYVCIGKSGLCLLAFLGAGHTPESNTRYAEVTRRAVAFLLDIQDEETGHFGWTSAYSHAIATYALAECFAITKAERLRKPLELAVAEIVRNQNRKRDPRSRGGWGYYNPEGPHFDGWSRVSVSGWQVMALESARLAGLEVEDEVFVLAGQFLQNAFDQRRGYFRYNHDPDRLNSTYRTLPASTPAALFALSLLGDDITAREFRRPREFVLERAPRRYRCESEHEFVQNASGNLYFWYYASLAMFRCGGREWQTWNRAMKQTLLPSQASDGSWKPISPYAERARDTNRDRSYSTAMCVLSLEVYYRYFTPLLKIK